MQASLDQEEMTRSNLSQSLFNLMERIFNSIIHVTGMPSKNDKKATSVRKLRASFKGVDVTDMDTTGGV